MLAVLRLAYGEYTKLLLHCVLTALCAACCAAVIYGTCVTGLEGLENQEVCDGLLAVMPGAGDLEEFVFCHYRPLYLPPT